MKLASVVILCTISLYCRANDGCFKVNGNQLIPMYETDISVQKEILTIKRVSSMRAEITVYYEFFNPKEEKELEVGFEAYSPYGDVSYKVTANGQPFIRQFTVNLNGAAVPWHVVIVRDKSYYHEGRFKGISPAEADKESGDEEFVDFFYVYHFKAVFHKGLNVLQHTYTVDLSSSVSELYSLQYVLTAAKRWANRQIDDFTLQIDMGDYQDLSIPETFFQHANEWTMTNPGKYIERKGDQDIDKASGVSEFFVHKGMLVFKKTNFRPAGELALRGEAGYFTGLQTQDKHPEGDYKFNYRLDNLPFSADAEVDLSATADELSKKILRNLPFARRGYIFKTPEIQAYYERQPWYLADPSYVPDVGKLTETEKKSLGQKAGELTSP